MSGGRDLALGEQGGTKREAISFDTKRFSIRRKFLAKKRNRLQKLCAIIASLAIKYVLLSVIVCKEHGMLGGRERKSYCEWLSAFCIRWTGRLGFRSYFTLPDLIV
jgi:hypothetical protein